MKRPVLIKRSEKKAETQRKTPAGFYEPYQLNQSHYFLFFLLFLSLFACYKLAKPYLHAIILAIVLSTILHSVYDKIEEWVHGRKNLAAFFTCALLILVLLLPLTFMTIALIQQGVQASTAIRDWIAAGKYNELIDKPWVVKTVALGNKYLPDIKKFFPDFNLEEIRLDQILLSVSSSLGKNLLNQGGKFFGNITALIGQFFLMIFAFFFIIRDQETIFNAVLHLLPLSASYEQRILTKIIAVARSALLGTLVTALGQGAAGGLAFHIAGLPGLFWGAVMAFASLIPIIGSSIVWIPAAAYLFLSGRWGYGIFIVLWCVLVVGMIDNFVRPLFMKGSGGNMSTLLIFFSILGGLNYFGLIGVLYGPLIVGITLVLLYIYRLEFRSFLAYQDKL